MAAGNEQPRSSSESASKRLAPWAVSVALHAALVIGAAFIVWQVVEGPEDPPASAISFDAPSYNPTLIPDREIDSDDAEAAEAAAIEELLAPDPVLESFDFDELVEAAPAIDPLSMPVTTPDALTIEPPSNLGATFAGLAAGDARDVVYVVDGSGSMLTTLPDVMDRLRQSIDGLHPTQRFQVIVFQTVTDDDGATTTYTTPPMRAGKKLALLPASSDIKSQIESWITNTVRPRGRSNPRAALEAALDLKPDAIFLLSSRITDREGGSFNGAELLDWLDGANPIDQASGRRRVLIQTVQVLDEDPEELLRRIASAHSGANGYNYISREELTRAKADRTEPAKAPDEEPEGPQQPDEQR